MDYLNHNVKLFLDDLRPAPGGWILVKDAQHMMAEVLQYLGKIDAISLDNDLGEGSAEGIDFVEAFISLKLWVPVIYLHTANPIARVRIIGAFEAANEHIYMGCPIEIYNCPPPGFLEGVIDGWYANLGT